MANLEIIETYDDEHLEFNEMLGEYILTIAIAKEIVGNVYRDDGELKRRLRLNSNIVYNYIYNRGNTNNKKYTKIILNRTKEGRKFIFRCLESQLIADSKSGYNDLGSENLIDIANGNVIDREKVRANLISINTEEMIVNSKADLCGYSVLNPQNYRLWELDKYVD